MPMTKTDAARVIATDAVLAGILGPEMLVARKKPAGDGLTSVVCAADGAACSTGGASPSAEEATSESPPAAPSDARKDADGSTERVGLSDALLQPQAAYVAVCFSAGPKCQGCREFYPKLAEMQRSGVLEKVSLSPVLLLSGRNYRDAPDASYNEQAGAEAAHFGLPAVPRSDATRAVLDMLKERCGILTNPYVVVLRRATGQVLANGRDMRPELNALRAASKTASGLPAAMAAWEAALAAEVSAPAAPPVAKDVKGSGSADVLKPSERPTLRFRLGLGGSKPHLLACGHRVVPGSDTYYVDEEVVRIRAGLLHITAWLATMQTYHRSFFQDRKTLMLFLYPIVCWEMLVASYCGVGPFAPYGVVATVIAHVLRRPVVWKPQTPKRFAWWLGFLMASWCFVAFIMRVELGWDQPAGTAMDKFSWYSIVLVLLFCQIATWLEAACGFCLGCFMWNYMVVPLLNKCMPSKRVTECAECKA